MKHGELKNYVRSPLYIVWSNIKARCLCKTNPGFRNYGGRGISICPEWKSDFSAFRNWAIVSGYVNGLQIDRVNNNGNYEPSNCRWVTSRQNGLNKRNTIIILGETAEVVAGNLGLATNTIRNRIKQLGWSPELAARVPKGGRLKFSYGHASRISGIPQVTIWRRVVKDGWSLEKAMTVPPIPHGKRRSLDKSEYAKP